MIFLNHLIFGFPGSSSPERFRQYAASPAANMFYVPNPYSSNGFAPPPSSRHNRMLNVVNPGTAKGARYVLSEVLLFIVTLTSS